MGSHLIPFLPDLAALSHFILSIWVVSLSMIFGLSTFTYALTTLSSVYGWMVGLLTFLISYYMLRFYADIVLNMQAFLPPLSFCLGLSLDP